MNDIMTNIVSDWPTMEPEAADLFGGDLFGDELLDIYNTSETCGDGNGPVVPLSNDDIPNILEQNDMDLSGAKTPSRNSNYGGLGSLKTSQSMNEFTSILEEGHTPNKVPAVATTATTVTVDAGQQIGKKRPAVDQPQTVQVTKKKVIETTTVNSGLPPPVRPAPPQNIKQETVTVNNGQESTKINTNISTDKSLATHRSAISQTVQKKVVVEQKVQNIQPVLPKTQTTHLAVKTTTLVPTVSNTKINPSSSASVTTTDSKVEDSFKGVAQAAVNNLILSAGQTASRFDSNKNESFSKAVDTSTSHVAALTSNNWVAACAASISDAPPGTAEAAQAAALAAAGDPAAAKAARARRATLTVDERARQNRDRNREHARNTRLRKKAYVEELKRTLTELVTARDTSDLERRHEKQRDLEVREVRYRVMEEFLKLRARGTETNLLARWVAILEDGFTLNLPCTEYREMVNYQGLKGPVTETTSTGVEVSVDPSLQVLRGATECFDDASKMAHFFQSLSSDTVSQLYNCDRKKFMMDGVNAMLEWTFMVSNIGNGSSIVIKGSMRASFSPASNKLVCAGLSFDTGSVVSQVKSIIPYQDSLTNNASGLPCIAETDALLDSVLPQASTSTFTKIESNLPCSVSVVSQDKGDSSSDEGDMNQQKKIIIKQE